MKKLKPILRRRWPLLLAGALIGAVASFGISVGEADTAAPGYTAKQIVFLDLTQNSGSGLTVISQGAALITQGRVPEVAAEKLAYDGRPTDLAKKISTVVDGESLSIEIYTSHPDPEVAVERASAFSDAFIEVVSAQSLAEREAVVEDTQAAFDTATAGLAQFDEANPQVAGLIPIDTEQEKLVASRNELVDAFAIAQEDLKEAQQALNLGPLYFTQGPEQPTRNSVSSIRIPTSRWFNTAALAALGLLLAGVLVALLERLNPRIDTKQDIDEEFDFPVIGEVIKLRRMHRGPGKRSEVSLDLPSAESYRRVRSVFRFAIGRNAEARSTSGGNGQDPGATVFMVVSALPDEGKSTTVAMTALALAEAGVPTLALGCDYRRPTIDSLLGVTATAGITSRAVMSIDRPELADIVFHTSHENLWIAPSGPSTANVAGCADVARELIAAARGEGLTVIVDTTPMLLANDAAELLDAVDDIVLVVRAGQTPTKSVHQLVDLLEQQGRRPLGAILIGSPDLSRLLNYYSDYYDEEPRKGSSRTAGGAAPPPPTAHAPVHTNGTTAHPPQPSETLR